jgi:hypothetical protein
MVCSRDPKGPNTPPPRMQVMEDHRRPLPRPTHLKTVAPHPNDGFDRQEMVRSRDPKGLNTAPTSDVFDSRRVMENPRGPSPRPTNAYDRNPLKRVAPESPTPTPKPRRRQPASSVVTPTGGVDDANGVRRKPKWTKSTGQIFGASSQQTNTNNPQGNNDRARGFQSEVSGIPGPSSNGKQRSSLVHSTS